MRITHVRIRKLVSHPHQYGHDAIELEAEVAQHEHWQIVADMLRHEVETQLRQAGECKRLSSHLDDLRNEVRRAEDMLARINAAIARKRGLDPAASDDAPEMPF